MGIVEAFELATKGILLEFGHVLHTSDELALSFSVLSNMAYSCPIRRARWTSSELVVGLIS